MSDFVLILSRSPSGHFSVGLSNVHEQESRAIPLGHPRQVPVGVATALLSFSREGSHSEADQYSLRHLEIAVIFPQHMNL